MSRTVHQLTVVQPTDGEAVMSVMQVGKIGQSDFNDLVCGGCLRVIIPNASLFDANSNVSRSRILVACPECGKPNELTDGRGKNRT